jgi:two-component system, OmpR family, phosphate regulon sensor histidine kinase PhoR
MSSDSPAESRLRELEAKCARLESELERAQAEQVNYLQNVSHQLVAPLNAIKWHIENLTEGRVNVERAKKVLRSIYSQSTLAVHLAKNFALMSNLEHDQALSTLKEPLQEVPLCGLLINLSDDFQPLSWDKSMQIGVETAGFETAPPVLIMKPLISQAFSNIIENAVKYGDNGSAIKISGRYDKQNDVVLVSIESRGIPLPIKPSVIFERGFRSADAKNKHPAGTGFGLYIAKRIVDIHEGRISAKTNEHGLAVFTVILSVSGLKGAARTRDPKDSSARR